MTHKKPAVIFDFDGTIADSFDYVADFLISQVTSDKRSEINKDELKNMSMLAMARELNFSNWRLPAIYLRGRRRMHQAILGLRPYAGIPEVLDQLSKDKHQIFVLSSNNKKNIRAFLRANKLHDHFDKIYGGVGVFGKAPAMRRLLKEHHIAASDAVYIGDELRDVEAAQYIGLPIIAVDWGFARPQDLIDQKPTFIADSPKNLIKLINKIGK